MELGLQPAGSPRRPLIVTRAASPRLRRSLGRSIRGIVQQLEGRALPSAVPLYSRGARPHLDLLRALADRLLTVDRPVSPVGLVLLEDLLTDGYGSPLYVPDRAPALRPALEHCLAALEPTGEAR